MKIKKSQITILIFSIFLLSCSSERVTDDLPWENHGKLQVEEGLNYIEHQDGTPFLWLGCTAWGMTEWLSREDVELYLDDRKSKGMNVVQFCLFWGKREDEPIRFTANAPNHYGHQALSENNDIPDALHPAVKEGGSPENPNDYWDHVDFCIQAIRDRGMYAAVLPFWGRRYVNAVYPDQSSQIFTLQNIYEYGNFLGSRYKKEPHIIWVNGGDVMADAGGNFIPYYRLLAEGLAKGVTGKSLKWDQEALEWDQLLLTYHPDGTPMRNSSTWFHNDVWLDFNMIETHTSRNMIVPAIRQDLSLNPLKPTVMAEGHYEGYSGYSDTVKAIHIRRQAYQTFFAGAAGHTYGGFFDEDGNGPLFSVSNNWKGLLDWEGASQMLYLRNFLEEHKWPHWKLLSEYIVSGQGEGELEKVAVKADQIVFIYFPENSTCTVKNMGEIENITCFDPRNGKLTPVDIQNESQFSLPADLEDGVLIIKYAP